jgi:hypothetical protein
MQNLIWIVTVLIALGGLVLICLLLNMLRTGDYSALVGNTGQRSARAQSQATLTLAATTTTFADLADVLLLRREPEVAHFSEDPLELTDEVQKKKVAEDLAKIRKRAG